MSIVVIGSDKIILPNSVLSCKFLECHLKQFKCDIKGHTRLEDYSAGTTISKISHLKHFFKRNLSGYQTVFKLTGGKVQK
jgi:hypothetical protein